MSGAEDTMTVHLDDALCADLVLRLTPPGEREAALAHAAACPECEARLRAHVSVAERAASDWAARDAHEAWTTAPSNPPAPVARVPVEVLALRPRVAGELPRNGVPGGARAAKPARVSPWRDTRVLTVAAAALFVLAIAWPLIARMPWSSQPSWLPASGETVRTREGEREDPRLAAGLAAYDARDLATADRELSAAHAAGATDLMRRLYLGHVRLERGDAHGAVEMLSALPWKLIPEPWRRDGVRVFARALRQDGDVARADSIERALQQTDSASPFVP